MKYTHVATYNNDVSSILQINNTITQTHINSNKC